MEITVAVRENKGTRNAKRSRKSGEIPGVIYGVGKQTEHLSINARDFGRLVSREGTGKLIELKIQKGKTAENDHVLIKGLQRHPVQGNIIHVDFLRVAMDQLVTVKVPVVNDEKKTRDGGIVELMLHELEVSCLPGNIPNRIQVQTADLTIGSKIHVKDLDLGQGVKAVTPLEEVVILAVSPTVAVETETETTEEPATTEPEVVKESKEEA